MECGIQWESCQFLFWVHKMLAMETTEEIKMKLLCIQNNKKGASNNTYTHSHSHSQTHICTHPIHNNHCTIQPMASYPQQFLFELLFYNFPISMWCGKRCNCEKHPLYLCVRIIILAKKKSSTKISGAAIHISKHLSELPSKGIETVELLSLDDSFEMINLFVCWKLPLKFLVFGRILKRKSKFNFNIYHCGMQSILVQLCSIFWCTLS